jgi:hypothetical protein
MTHSSLPYYSRLATQTLTLKQYLQIKQELNNMHYMPSHKMLLLMTSQISSQQNNLLLVQAKCVATQEQNPCTMKCLDCILYFLAHR